MAIRRSGRLKDDKSWRTGPQKGLLSAQVRWREAFGAVRVIKQGNGKMCRCINNRIEVYLFTQPTAVVLVVSFPGHCIWGRNRKITGLLLSLLNMPGTLHPDS